MTHAHIETLHERNVFGFWIYLMTDCILFATLFATYAVLHTATFGGPKADQIFDLPLVLAETLCLLTSSFTGGLAMVSAKEGKRKQFLALLGITFLLGVSFLIIELSEFTKLVQEGNSWQRSAFLSSYFTLVGTHGAHITCGLLWLLVIAFQVFFRGFTSHTIRRATCFTLFWHFLDVVWIFIFTLVYLNVSSVFK